jgi:hypothetical protein
MLYSRSGNDPAGPALTTGRSPVRAAHVKGMGIGQAELVAKEFLEPFKPAPDLKLERKRADQIGELEQFRPTMEPGSALEQQLDRVIERISVGGGSGLSTFKTRNAITWSASSS